VWEGTPPNPPPPLVRVEYRVRRARILVARLTHASDVDERTPDISEIDLRIERVRRVPGIVLEPQEGDGHVGVADEAQGHRHDLQRRIRVGGTLDVVEELGTVVGAVAHAAVLEVDDE